MLVSNNDKHERGSFYNAFRHKRSPGGCSWFCGGPYPNCQCGRWNIVEA